jgi:hypothetical protein
MISIEVTENDIIRAMKNIRFSPVQLAVSRKFNTNPEDVDVGQDRIFVWSDDEDHKTYILQGDIEEFDSFMEEWEFYAEDDVDFTRESFVLHLSEKNSQSFA